MPVSLLLLLYPIFPALFQIDNNSYEILYVKSDIYLYIRDGEGVAHMIPKGTNLMDYAGQTFFISDQVCVTFLLRFDFGSVPQK